MKHLLTLALSLLFTICACNSPRHQPTEPQGSEQTGTEPTIDSPVEPTPVVLEQYIPELTREDQFAPATSQQETLYQSAAAALEGGHTELAISILASIQETTEVSEIKASAMLLLSDLYQAEGETDLGLSVLENLMVEAPPIAELELVLGRLLGDLQRFDEAEFHLRRAIEIKEELLQAYLDLGALLAATDRIEEAAATFGRYEIVMTSLLEALTDGSLTRDQRLFILASLIMASPDDRITNTGVELLADEDPAIVSSVINLLMEIGTVGAIAPLDALANTPPLPALGEMAEAAARHIQERSADRESAVHIHPPQ